MSINVEVLKAFKRVETEYLAAKEKYQEMLTNIGLPVPEELEETSVQDFNKVESIQFFGETEISRELYYQCGGYYNYYLVTTDTTMFFVISGMAYDHKGGGDYMTYEPSMSKESRKAYLEYLRDNYDESKHIRDISGDPEGDLEILKKNIEAEKREAQIAELFTKVDPLYELIIQHITDNWSAKDYRLIAGNDMEAKAAITSRNAIKFSNNWNQIAAVLSQSDNIDKDTVTTISNLSEELKTLS